MEYLQYYSQFYLNYLQYLQYLNIFYIINEDQNLLGGCGNIDYSILFSHTGHAPPDLLSLHEGFLGELSLFYFFEKRGRKDKEIAKSGQFLKNSTL